MLVHAVLTDNGKSYTQVSIRKTALQKSNETGRSGDMTEKRTGPPSDFLKATGQCDNELLLL